MKTQPVFLIAVLSVIVPSAEKQKQIADAVWKAARAPRKADGSLPDLVIRR